MSDQPQQLSAEEQKRIKQQKLMARLEKKYSQQPDIIQPEKDEDSNNSSSQVSGSSIANNNSTASQQNTTESTQSASTNPSVAKSTYFSKKPEEDTTQERVSGTELIKLDGQRRQAKYTLRKISNLLSLFIGAIGAIFSSYGLNFIAVFIIYQIIMHNFVQSVVLSKYQKKSQSKESANQNEQPTAGGASNSSSLMKIGMHLLQQVHVIKGFGEDCAFFLFGFFMTASLI